MKSHRTIFYIVASTVISLMCLTAEARSIKMLFWYPGEAGSTAEAQPVLDVFFDYISSKIKPDTINGKYFNSVDEGAAYIKKERPQIAIVSYAASVQNRDKIGDSEVLCSTIPSTSGKTHENYSLVGATDKLASGATILSSEPMTLSFVREKLFTQIPADAKISNTAQLVMKLKDIAGGKLSAFAILTPTEALTLARLSTPWAKGLKTVAQSSAVPTARVLVLDRTWSERSRLEAALLSAGEDPKARDILDELRLKGFAKP